MCDEYRLNADMRLALGPQSAGLGPAEQRLLAGGEIAVRHGDPAPLLVPRDPAAPQGWTLEAEADGAPIAGNGTHG